MYLYIYGFVITKTAISRNYGQLICMISYKNILQYNVFNYAWYNTVSYVIYLLFE